MNMMKENYFLDLIKIMPITIIRWLKEQAKNKGMDKAETILRRIRPSLGLTVAGNQLLNQRLWVKVEES